VFLSVFVAVVVDDVDDFLDDAGSVVSVSVDPKEDFEDFFEEETESVLLQFLI
jgi:hypothetical protein